MIGVIWLNCPGYFFQGASPLLASELEPHKYFRNWENHTCGDKLPLVCPA